jgi:hypothetical protein
LLRGVLEEHINGISNPREGVVIDNLIGRKAGKSTVDNT